MKTQYVYALIEMDDKGNETIKSWWTRKADIAKYLGVTNGCVNIASSGICKCNGYRIDRIDLNKLLGNNIKNTSL